MHHIATVNFGLAHEKPVCLSQRGGVLSTQWYLTGAITHRPTQRTKQSVFHATFHRASPYITRGT
jgi:hypothetical protein